MSPGWQELSWATETSPQPPSPLRVDTTIRVDALAPRALGCVLAPGLLSLGTLHLATLHTTSLVPLDLTWRFDPPVGGGHNWTCPCSLSGQMPECPSAGNNRSSGIPGGVVTLGGQRRLPGPISPDRRVRPPARRRLRPHVRPSPLAGPIFVHHGLRYDRAPAEGFEPPASWSEAMRSIH